MSEEKERYYDVSEDTINDFMEIFDSKVFSVKVAFQFIGDNKLKSAITIKKMSPEMVFVTGKDITVLINEDKIMAYDDEMAKILMEQEIDKIDINIEKGTIKLRKTDLNTFSAIINKYGVEKVSRANQVETLYQEQTEDANEFL